MDDRPKTRPVDRERKPSPPQPPRGAKQIVIPMTRTQCDEIWHETERLRAFLAGWARSAPEPFPAGFDRGYRLHRFGRPSRKLPGLKLRKIVRADDSSYWLRPSFIAGYMAGRRRGMLSPRRSPPSRWCLASRTGSSRSATAAARPTSCTAGCGTSPVPPPRRSFDA